MPNGSLVTVEGIDGAGKTTLVAALADLLDERGVPVHALREPGGVELAERVRALLLDPALEISPRAEALLYAAARAELVEQAIRPLLASGSLVLLDRFVDSSLAYQGVARELGVEPVRALNDFATAGLTPDRTLLLRVEATVGRSRLGGGSDRIEREDGRFFAAVAAAYERLAAAEPRRVRVIDAAQPPALVLREALAQISDLLPDGQTAI